ncbi:MAG: MarR family transcriptional regulator [Lachnospiraceae bacterium]|nr:MarR family transcriptional regulator [Lachnospiraceae bacterium]
MLEKSLLEVHTKLKIHFYQEMFKRLHSRETSLSTVETFCVEVIYALGEPTVAKFAKFINVSSPNATYKVNSLIKKGYIEKIRSETDKREYHLRVTEKFRNYYALSSDYVDEVVKRARERFEPKTIDELDKFLSIMSEELMNDVPISLELPDET